jgi:hypothetical protein
MLDERPEAIDVHGRTVGLSRPRVEASLLDDPLRPAAGRRQYGWHRPGQEDPEERAEHGRETRRHCH